MKQSQQQEREAKVARTKLEIEYRVACSKLDDEQRRHERLNEALLAARQESITARQDLRAAQLDLSKSMENIALRDRQLADAVASRRIALPIFVRACTCGFLQGYLGIPGAQQSLDPPFPKD